MSLAIDRLALISVAVVHSLLLMNQCQYTKVMLHHLTIMILTSRLMASLVQVTHKYIVF